MADSRGPGQTPGEDQPDRAAAHRRAQDAARDLERMGIDPRSLGLGAGEPLATSTAPRAGTEGAAASGGADVVPLRPAHPAAARAAEEAADGAAAVRPAGSEAGAEAGAEPADAATAVAADSLLARTAPPPPREAARLLRLVGRGLLTPDAAVSAQNERALVEAVRHRQSDRRIVAFVSARGGVGCTTLAVGVGTALTALREDRTVVVDVQSGALPLSGLHATAGALSLTALPRGGEPLSPPVAASGLGLVDGGSWDEVVTRDAVAAVLDRLGADHTFLLLDAGDEAGEGSHAALARADQVVVVSGPGPSGQAAMAEALARVRAVNPALPLHAVQVVVCPHEEAHRVTSRAQSGRPSTVVVPPDRHLAAGRPYDAGQVGAATREALLRVAAAVALGSVRA
jgi:MinD-like ATPase involved in chromosome partitioning or flagellar assembly